MNSFVHLALLVGVATAVPTQRTALFWLESFPHCNNISCYEAGWKQWATNHRPGYLIAARTWLVHANGSLGLCNDLDPGSCIGGKSMERHGLPALKKLGLRTLGMIYFTDTDGIAKIVAKPEPFIQTLVEKGKLFGLDGFDFDYEPGQTLRDDVAKGWMQFMKKAAAAMVRNNMQLTIDIASCPESFGFKCAEAYTVPGFTQANTMDSFNVQSIDDFNQSVGQDRPSMKDRWAPGFEPAGTGERGFKKITQYMLKKNITRLSTWGVGGPGLGPGVQPQWFFDTVNKFLDGVTDTEEATVVV